MEKIRDVYPRWLDKVKAKRDTIARDEDLAWSVDKLRAIAQSVQSKPEGHTLGAATLMALGVVDEERVTQWLDISEVQMRKVTLERLTKYLHDTTSRTAAELELRTREKTEYRGSQEEGRRQRGQTPQVRAMTPLVTAEGTKGGSEGGGEGASPFPQPGRLGSHGSSYIIRTGRHVRLQRQASAPRLECCRKGMIPVEDHAPAEGI